MAASARRLGSRWPGPARTALGAENGHAAAAQHRGGEGAGRAEAARAQQALCESAPAPRGDPSPAQNLCPAPSLPSVFPRAPGPRTLPAISPRAPGPRALPAISPRAPALPTHPCKSLAPAAAGDSDRNQERDPRRRGFRPPSCPEAPSLVGPASQAPRPSEHGSFECPSPVTSV